MAGSKTGRFAILEQLLADGIRYIFGNPGTSEEGFLDALWDYPELKYILTLHENVAVMMADGYARATQKPAVVQIHSTPGLGNAIGALYQAKRGHSPLLVIGGDAGIRYQALDAQMAGDLVAFAEPVTKWATMVNHPASLLRVLRKALKIAATPPMGPVYVCLPMDILDAPLEEEVMPTSFPSTRVMPSEGCVRDMAYALKSAQKPMIFIGDGIAHSGAQKELAAVAEKLGAEVWGVDAGDLNMSHQHPLYQGMTGHMFGYQSLPITRKGDVNLVCGTYLMPEVFPELGNIFAPGAKVIHIDLNAYEIAKNFPVTQGVVSDPKLTLAALSGALDAVMLASEKEAARNRLAEIMQAKENRLQKELEADLGKRGDLPMDFSCFASELAKQLPADAVIFDEALTNSPALTRYLPPAMPGHYFLSRGGSLGVGITGAIGAKLANPDKTVVAVAGDGGSMYTIQALWSAVRHEVDAKFVICNNASYRLLQVNLDAYWKERGLKERDYPLSFDLSRPVLRFDLMAQAMGMEALRVERLEEIKPAIEAALKHKGPFLLDVVLEGDTHPEMVGVRCGQ